MEILIVGGILAMTLWFTSGLIGRVCGRNRTGFWWGFWFGPLGWLIAFLRGSSLADAEAREDAQERRHREMLEARDVAAPLSSS